MAHRFGFGMAVASDQPVVWIHAASLGELTAVRPFLSYLAKNHSGNQLLITTNNPAALDVARRWPELRATFQAAPLDLPFVLKRFLRHWDPVAFINIESEIWPNRFAALISRSVPAIMLNARLSDKSVARYRVLGASRVGFPLFRQIFAQNEDSAQNFKTIGIAEDQVETIPNFKSLVALPEPDSRLINMFERSKTILAASTHVGEDIEILKAFAKLRHADPQLRLIHAPRHPERATEVAQLAHDLGLSTGMLSGSIAGASVIIVDSLGELQRLYALASVAFVGGSLLAGIGGHTPYEPIRAGAAIVTGQFTDNFVAEYEKLRKNNACCVTDIVKLDTDLQSALTNAPAMAVAASQVLPVFDQPETLFHRIAAHLELDQ